MLEARVPPLTCGESPLIERGNFLIVVAKNICWSILNGMKIFALSMAFVFITTIFAFTDAEIGQLKERVGVLEQQRKDLILPAYRCAQNGTGISCTGSPLIWKVSEDGLEYAITGSYDIVSTTSVVSGATVPVFYRLNLENGRTRHPQFHWDWGFRVGLEYDMPFDGWGLFSSWTSLDQHAHDTVTRGGDPNPGHFSGLLGDPTSGAGDFISPFWAAQLFSSPGLVNVAKVHWDLQLNLVDLVLGREFFVSRGLALKPFIGMRSGWIHQTYNMSFIAFNFPTDPSAISRQIFIHMKNNFWGIGVRAGLDTQWFLGKGLSVFGNAAFSFLNGRFHTRYKLVDQKPVITTAAVGAVQGGSALVDVLPAYDDSFANKNRVHTDVAMADLTLGLRWDKTFCEGRWCFGIWGGYEQSIFFEQNRFMNFQNDFTLVAGRLFAPPQQSSGPNFFTDRGNLVARGFTGGLEFGF